MTGDRPRARRPGECPGGLVFVLTTEAGEELDVGLAAGPAGITEMIAVRHGEAVRRDPTLVVMVFDGDSGFPLARLGVEDVGRAR